MSADGFNDRRRRKVHEEHPDERWLLTYADMITLLMALFIVMWAISSVNTSKFEELKISLNGAFNGKPIPGGQSVLSGGREVLSPEGGQIEPIQSTDSPAGAKAEETLQDMAAAQEAEDLRRIKAKLEAFAATHGFAARVRARIDERGLVIRLLTDDVLFDSGDAVVKQGSVPLLSKIAELLTSGDVVNPIRVEGNTDNVPISTARFLSNWELSTGRATAVLQHLLDHGVGAKRLSAAGYADQHSVAGNHSAEGRALNRRVELVVLRRFTQPSPPGGVLP